MDLVEIGMRVRQVRKGINLTQAEFGEKIGVAGDAVLNIELARNKKLQESTLKLIALKFGINYDWLLAGQGDMKSTVNPIVSMLDSVLEGENETAKAVFRAFAELDEEDWKTVQKFIDALKKEGAQ